MDYYASWPRSTVPKWVGVTLGGIFTLIIVVCVGMIVHLLRPPMHAPLAVVAAAEAAPKPSPSVPAIAPARVARPASVAASAPVAARTSVAQATPVVAKAAKKHSAHAHKRAILAKHEGKASHSSKSDIDRILGL